MSSKFLIAAAVVACASWVIASTGAAQSCEECPPPPGPVDPLEKVREVLGPVDPTSPPTIQVRPVVAQPTATMVLPTSASATVASRKGIFALVGVAPGEVAQVTIRYPQPFDWQLIDVEMLDGGTLFVPNATRVVDVAAVGETVQRIVAATGIELADNGTVPRTAVFTFTVQLGTAPGLYQVRVRRGAEIIGLRFWVSDPQNPQNDPPTTKPMLLTQGGVP